MKKKKMKITAKMTLNLCGYLSKKPIEKP